MELLELQIDEERIEKSYIEWYLSTSKNKLPTNGKKLYNMLENRKVKKKGEDKIYEVAGVSLFASADKFEHKSISLIIRK